MNDDKLIQRLERIFQVYPSGNIILQNEQEINDFKKDVIDGNQYLSQLIKELKVQFNKI